MSTNKRSTKTIIILLFAISVGGLFIFGGANHFRDRSADRQEGTIAGSRKDDVDDAQEKGIVLFQERFLRCLKCTGKEKDPMYDDIRETTCWRFVQKEMTGTSAPFAKKKKDCFTVDTEIPLEYTFTPTLSEHTMYCYMLCVSAKGNGTISLSSGKEDRKKVFWIHSSRFETISLPLGNGSTFHRGIMPTIVFQGKLQIEAITLYQKKINGERTVCLGTINSISNVPDIEQSNYPDCFYTAIYTVKEILDGNPVQETIQLLIPAFRANKINPLSRIREPGDYKIAIRPFLSAPKEEQEIEQVDEIESYEYTPYILVDAADASIPLLHTSGIPILEGTKYVSPYDNPVNPPLSERIRNDSQETISGELEKVRSILSVANNVNSINSAFQSTWNKTQKKYDSLNKEKIWAHEKDSFFALPKKWTFIHPGKINDHNLNALIELDRFFKSQGILFILQIVPDYRDIAALVLNPGFQQYGDQQTAVVAEQLLKNGIEAQYLSDELVKNAFRYERLFFYPDDFHPDEGTMDIMTSLMEKRLKPFQDLFPRQLTPELFSKELHDTGYGNNLKWPADVDIGTHKAKSNVQTPYFYYDQSRILPNEQSEILVFGNSFIAEPMDSNAYISYLASKLLHVPASKTMSGVSALTGLPQLFLIDCKNILKGKRFAILPISIEFLTGDGYCFTNIKELDSSMKQNNKASFLSRSNLANRNSVVFPTSINLSYPKLREYFFNHTGIVSLSEEQPELFVDVPDGISPRTARISIQPYALPEYNFKASVIINGHKHQLVSNLDNPNWEIIDFEIPENMKTIPIRFDLDNSSKDAVVFIHDVSFF